MARSSLSDIQGSIIDPALPWNFDLIFDKLPTGMPGDVRSLTIRCQATSLPGQSHNQVEVSLHGIVLRFRGRKTFGGTFDVTFAENSSPGIEVKETKAFSPFFKQPEYFSET